MAEGKPVGEVWSIKDLRSRMGFVSATREMKRRCEAGAVAACGIYASQVKHWISVAVKTEERAGRDPVIDALTACGEDEIIRKIEDLHASGTPITSKHILDFQEDWLREFQDRIGREVPSASEITKQEIEESKRIARELHKIPPKKEEAPKPKEAELAELEEMKKALEKRMQELRKK